MQIKTYEKKYLDSYNKMKYREYPSLEAFS